MGQYSWRDCVTGKPILDDVEKTSYVLVPREFGGGHISERRYDGYGHFGGYDIYELVLEWNKKYIPQYVKLMEAGKWECEPYTNDINDLIDYYNDQPVDVDLRDLGITLACYDEDNARLKYPIKITYDETAVYEDYPYSPSDPNQGWGGSESGTEFYAITGTIPARDTKLNKRKVKDILNKIFSYGIEGTPEIDIRNAEEERDWQDDMSIGDNEFGVTIHVVLQDIDEDTYYLDRIYDFFEREGYSVDVYYETES